MVATNSGIKEPPVIPPPTAERGGDWHDWHPISLGELAVMAHEKAMRQLQQLNLGQPIGAVAMTEKDGGSIAGAEVKPWLGSVGFGDLAA